MSALPIATHWAILFPALTIFMATAVVLTQVLRNRGEKRWFILVPISGVLLIAGAAYSLAQVGVFCAFCK